MNRSLYAWAWLMVLGLASQLCAQGPYRQLAPGVMKSVDPAQKLDESVSRHDVVELLAVDPKSRLGQGRPVPPRRLGVGLQVQARADDLGRHSAAERLHAAEADLVHGLLGHQHREGYAPGPKTPICLTRRSTRSSSIRRPPDDRPVQFSPEFLLEGHQRMSDEVGFTKVYPDRVIPVAMDPIRLREDPNRRFLTSVEMCRETCRGRDPLGRRHLGGHRPADRPLLGLRLGAYQRLPLDGRGGRVQEAATRSARAASSTERR